MALLPCLRGSAHAAAQLSAQAQAYLVPHFARATYTTHVIKLQSAHAFRVPGCHASC